MALENGNGGGIPATMLVGPSGYAGGYGNDGFGGGWFAWILLALLFGGGFGFGGMGGYGGFGGMYEFPWILNGQNTLANNTNAGFRDAALSDGINGIRSDLGDISTQLCGGFAGVNATVNGAQNAIAQQLYTNEIASLNRSFAEQTANTAGFNGVQSGLCDIRYGSATNTRDIIESQTRGTQAVLDKLCQLELDGYKRELDSVRSQLSDAKIAASQTAQNAFIAQGLNNEVDALYNRLASCPVPTTPVYGRTPIFTCGGNSVGCGCGGVA